MIYEEIILILLISVVESRTPIFIAAPPTGMHIDRSLNLSVIIDQANMLCDNKIDAVFVTGTTGESVSLTSTERKSVLDAWIATKKSTTYPLKIIMHVGAESLEIANSLALYAEQVGADAIGAMPPSFFKAGDADTLANSMAVVTNGTTLPFYYYHIPDSTGVTVNMVDFLPVATQKIPTFQGIKYTSYDLYQFGLCVTWMDNYNSKNPDKAPLEMLYGHDECMLAAWTFGATGFVGSTYNFFGDYFHGIIDSFQKGSMEEAWDQQAKAQLMVQAMLAPEGATPGCKAVMQLVGVDTGPCRLPLNTVSDTQRQALGKTLHELGFL